MTLLRSQLLCVNPPTADIKLLCSTQGHIGYYQRFIQNYATITEPLELLLNKFETTLYWSPECKEAFHFLKEKLVSAPIRMFPNEAVQFHVHVDASGIAALGAVLTQPGERDLDHPIYFASKTLYQADRNYTTMKREGLAMVHALQKLFH